MKERNTNLTRSIKEIIPKSFSNSFNIDRKIFGKNLKAPKNLSRFVKWPKYIKIQRQRKLFSQKLKVPPSIFQFTRTLDKDLTRQVFNLLKKFQKKDTQQSENIEIYEKKKKNRFLIKHGVNTVANLIKKKKALFVLIAHDVNPIECVIWLPSLCNHFNIPFSIIKSKSKMGQVVDRKKASCLALTLSNKIEKTEVSKIIDCFRIYYNNQFEETIRKWGGVKK